MSESVSPHEPKAKQSKGAKNPDVCSAHKRTNVSPQNVLHVLLGVTTLDDESVRTIDRTTRSQLGKEERNDVLVLSVHLLANVGQVGKDRLLVTLSKHLRGSNRVASSVSVKFGVLGSKDSEGPREELA